MESLQANIDGTLRTASEGFGNWQEYKGGRVTTDSTTTRDPGAKYARIIPGRKSIETITLTRDYEPTRDADAEDRLEALAGTQEMFIVGKVIRDPGSGAPIRVKTRVGKLLEVMGPEGNTNGGTDKATLEVVIGIDG